MGAAHRTRTGQLRGVVVQLDERAMLTLARDLAAICRELGPCPLSYELLDVAEAALAQLVPSRRFAPQGQRAAAQTLRPVRHSQFLATGLVGHHS